jgi:hypothetical protein
MRPVFSTRDKLAGAKRAAQARLPHVTPRSATMCHSGRQQKKPKGSVRFEPDMAGSKVLKWYVDVEWDI